MPKPRWRVTIFPPGTHECPRHPGVALVTSCPACVGAQGGRKRTAAQLTARRANLAKGRATKGLDKARGA